MDRTAQTIAGGPRQNNKPTTGETLVSSESEANFKETQPLKYAAWQMSQVYINSTDGGIKELNEEQRIGQQCSSCSLTTSMTKGLSTTRNSSCGPPRSQYTKDRT
jgi:hypothetical protein